MPFPFLSRPSVFLNVILIISLLLTEYLIWTYLLNSSAPAFVLFTMIGILIGWLAKNTRDEIRIPPTPRAVPESGSSSRRPPHMILF